jgi:hypothetical protein
LGSRIDGDHCINDDGHLFRVLDLSALAVEPAGLQPTRSERSETDRRAPYMVMTTDPWSMNGGGKQLSRERAIERQAARAAEARARADRDDAAITVSRDPAPHRCRNCGGSYDRQTDGCRVCAHRHLIRRSRERERNSRVDVAA